jgi:NAD(P)-dependent dehydrogenase (short-subunit alcohol dehydrogenase family)
MNPASYPERGDVLTDQIILVTGAGAGIGRDVARACALHQATVILLDKNQPALETLYDDIMAAGGTEPLIYRMNLEKITEKQALELGGGIYNEFGRLDGLLHNAAVLGTISPYAHYDANTWSRVMQVNTYAPFMLSKALIPLLKQSVNPSILFTSSEYGIKGKAYWGAYAASQFAIEGMAQTLADELESDGIRVNTIDPGIVRTGMRKLAFPGENMDALPQPRHIVDAYLQLFSDTSINGQRIHAWVKPDVSAG